MAKGDHKFNFMIAGYVLQVYTNKYINDIHRLRRAPTVPEGHRHAGGNSNQLANFTHIVISVDIDIIYL